MAAAAAVFLAGGPAASSLSSSFRVFAAGSLMKSLSERGMVRTVDGPGNILGTCKAGDHVTKVIAADINGDGRPEIVAGADDGFVYGDIK